MDTFDTLLLDANVIDGSGAAPFKANIGITGGEISYIGGELPQAGQIIDAAGRYVSPGFIDMHSHSDYTLPVYPDAGSAIAQGITTMAAGNCGMSPSPCGRLYLPFCYEERALAAVLPEPIGGVNPGFMQTVPPELLRESFRRYYGFDLDWHSFAEYAVHLRACGIAPNLTAMAGHGAIRLQVMGTDIRRAATETEVQEIAALCAQSMDEGAAGISFGLDYEPGGWADGAELEAVARCVASRGKTLAAHYQLRASRRGAVSPGHTPVDGIMEMLDLAERTGVHLHLSHLSVSYDIKPYDLELAKCGVRRVLDIIDEYRSRGVIITCDALPDYTGGDYFYPNIAQRFLPYVLQAGGMEAFSRALNTGNYKDLIAADIRAGRHASSSVMTRLDPVAAPHWGEGAVITRCSDKKYAGKTVGELCRETGRNYVSLLLDILSSDPYACYNMWSARGVGADTEVILTETDIPLGLDVSSVDYVQRTWFNDGRPENRRSTGTYCGFVKYLTSGIAPIESLVHRITGAAADVLGLENRGHIKKGAAADLVVFDAGRLCPNEDFVEPARRPSGIDCVFVNGVPVVLEGEFTGARPGMVLIS